MPPEPHFSWVFTSGGLSLHARVGRFLRIPLWAQCVIVSAGWAVTLITASAIDRSLFLPGPNVGLLQHPAVWSFVALQTVLPVLIQQSFRQVGAALQAPVTERLNDQQFVDRGLRGFVELSSLEGRLVAAFAYLLGLSAFVWNTIQN